MLWNGIPSRYFEGLFAKDDLLILKHLKEKDQIEVRKFSKISKIDIFVDKESVITEWIFFSKWK